MPAQAQDRKKTAFSKKTTLRIVREEKDLPPVKTIQQMLMPPLTEFNTGYHKPKNYDPL